MSLSALGLAEELRAQGVAANTLWPRVGIATAAIQFALADDEELKKCRTPEIMADAAYWILTQPSRACTGNCFIDDTLLYAAGERDFDRYRVDPAYPLRAGLFIPDTMPPPPGVTLGPVVRA
jgi:citronellol/citronellal dehydrogenase